MRDEEYVGFYVSKEIATKLKEAKDKKAIEEEFVLKWIDEQKKDIKLSVEALEDDLITFKAVAIKHKNQLKQAYEEQQVLVEKLYDDIWKKRDEVKYKIENVKNEMNDLTDIIQSVDKKLSGINIYKIEELLKLVNKISNMSTKEKRIMQFLMTNKADELI